MKLCFPMSKTWLLFLLAGSIPAVALGQPPRAPSTDRSGSYTQPSLEPLPEPDASTSRETLTLADLEGLALQHHPALATAAARVEAARGRWVQSGLYPNPVVGYNSMDVGNEGTAGQQGAMFRQEFVTAGKLRLSRAVANQEIRQFQFLLDAWQLRVLGDVRLRYYDALVAQRRVELTGELARIGDDLAASTRKLLAGRQVSENNLLQAEIEAEQAQILLDNARNEHAEAWRRLAAVIGIPTLPLTPLLGRLDAEPPSYEWDDCLALLLAESPQLAAAAARIEGARWAIARSRRAVIPNVDAMFGVLHDNMTGDGVAMVQVGVPLPVFDRNQGNILSAQAELAAAQSDMRRLELDLQDRLAMTFRRYANARQQSQRYIERILPRAGESLELTTNAYGRGQVDYLTLITSQRTYLQVNLAWLEAARELRQSAALIEGQLLSESLADRP